MNSISVNLYNYCSNNIFLYNFTVNFKLYLTKI